MRKYLEAVLYIIFVIVILINTIRATSPKIVAVLKVEKNLFDARGKVTELERRIESYKVTEQKKKTLTGQSKKVYAPDVANLGTESSFTGFFDTILQMLNYNGIKVYSIEYSYNPSEDEVIQKAQGKYNVCLLTMELVAGYSNLENFLKEIYKYPYLLNINELKISPYSKNKKILLTKLQLKLYSSASN